MTEKQMISTLKGLTFGTVVGSKGVEALDMAIQALSQEPICDRDCEHCTWTECPIEPCDDAVSRDAVREILSKYHLGESRIAEELNELPSVTQKSGKWDRLYSWLNDMRLGIAPDETVTDTDERHCRESQTDILDEIMEWMIKAEGSDKV